ncbi:Hypothetical_protein [Hexamita inflata]|uniref:Hypothetical_protein n=1 Tax=Hexamita inflata TaxID=28002 RepID=A0AA86TSU7_9EUKA|nr:Hypothetical protein HINF_LOCUS14775 [Hexamita inflata]CAI9927136.1 Hypothetical protein HINF_LOCUS14781 [Hexamita inflata]
MKVLALPDQLLTKFFVQLSEELNTEYRQLYHDFITNIPTKQTNTQHTYKFKLQRHRTLSQQQIIFNKQFAQALKTVMSSYFCECSIHFDDDVHLCQCINDYFSTHGQADFWVKMSKLITQKNERQLKEYYQKSFQRCMYLEWITEPDKELLCKLMEQMPHSKPYVIADQFTKIVGTEKYFKRNVVMYVVNRKNQ